MPNYALDSKSHPLASGSKTLPDLSFAPDWLYFEEWRKMRLLGDREMTTAPIKKEQQHRLRKNNRVVLIQIRLLQPR